MEIMTIMRSLWPLKGARRLWLILILMTSMMFVLFNYSNITSHISNRPVGTQTYSFSSTTHESRIGHQRLLDKTRAIETAAPRVSDKNRINGTVTSGLFEKSQMIGTVNRAVFNISRVIKTDRKQRVFEKTRVIGTDFSQIHNIGNQSKVTDSRQFEKTRVTRTNITPVFNNTQATESDHTRLFNKTSFIKGNLSRVFEKFQNSPSNLTTSTFKEVSQAKQQSKTDKDELKSSSATDESNRNPGKPTNKWIVLDGVTSQCDDVTSLINLLDEWRIIVVSSTNPVVRGCRYPRCILLNHQKHFADQRAKSIPSSSFLFDENILQGALSRFNNDAKSNNSTNVKYTHHQTEKPNPNQKLSKLDGFLTAISLHAEVIVDAKCPHKNIKTKTAWSPSSSFKTNTESFVGNDTPNNIDYKNTTNNKNNSNNSNTTFWSDFTFLKKYPFPKQWLFYDDSKLFNPFQHFGHENVYPRVFQYFSQVMPVSSNRSDCPFYEKNCRWHHSNSNLYYMKKAIPIHESEQMWQFVSPQYALCSKSKDSKPSVGFLDAQSPISTVSVNPYSLAPLDTGITLFPKGTFHLMFVPVMMSDNFQGLFRTAFIHIVRSLFHFPISYIKSHTIDTVYSEKVCMVSSKERLRYRNISIEELNNLRHNQSNNNCSLSRREEGRGGLINCAIILVDKLLSVLIGVSDKSNHKLKQKLLDIFIHWMNALHSHKTSLTPLENVRQSSRRHQSFFKIKYSFHLSDSLRRRNYSTLKLDYAVTKYIFNPINALCAKYTHSPRLFLSSWDSPVMRDVMLVVSINYDFLYNAITYLEYAYRPIFQHILYCGPNVHKFNAFAKSHGLDYVTFIDGFTDSWYFMYECTVHAMKLNLPVKGYLQIGDDTFLDIKKLYQLPRNKIWMPTIHFNIKLNDPSSNFGWNYWHTIYGRPAVLKSFEELQYLATFNFSTSANSISNFSNTIAQPNSKLYFKVNKESQLFAQRFLRNYYENGGRNLVTHRAMDIFYMPEILRDDFTKAAGLLRYHRCLVELAVPIIHIGLVPRSDIVYMEGSSLWGIDRNKPWLVYDSEKTFYIHPFKMLSHLTTNKGKRFFCQKYVPDLNDLKNNETGKTV